MPRKATFPPKLSLHKASGQAKVRYKSRDYYLGPWGSDEAARNYAELIKRLADHQDTEPDQARPLTVAEAVSRWNADEGKRYSGVELDHYQRAIACLLAERASVRMSDFGVADLERVRRTMISKDWSAGVVNRRISRLRTMWRWLERQGIAPRGSWDHLRSLPGIPRHDKRVRQTQPRKPATWADLVAVCKCAPEPIRSMLLLGWYAGARPGEICQMRLADIDRTDEVWVYRPARHKNDWRGQDRAIPLGRVCQRILSRFYTENIHRNIHAYLFVPDGVRKRRKRLHFQTNVYTRAVMRAARRAGVQITPYSLRHSFRLRVSREVGLEAARAAMGHSTVDTTLAYAAGADLELAKAAAKKVG